jgi:hypothetical protein
MKSPRFEIEISKRKIDEKSHLLILLWFVCSFTLGPNLLSQIIVIPPLRTVFLILSCLIMFRTLSGRIKLQNLKRNSYGRIIILGFVIYNMSLLLAAANNTNSDENFAGIFGNILLLIILILASMIMTEKIFTKCMNLYCIVLSVFAAFSIIVTLAILFLHVPPVNEFVAQEGRVYQNYIIALTEVAIDTIDIKRAGSFYDEPGTFAMFLTPAILWTAIVTPSTLIISILLVAFLLTFSVGGWMALGLSVVYVAMISPRVIKGYNHVIFTIVWLIVVITCVSYLFSVVDVSWMTKYVDNKFSGNEVPTAIAAASGGSSAEARLNEIDSFLKILSDKPRGYGVYPNQMNIQFSIGVMASSIQGGLLGVIGYSIAFGGILMGLVQHLIYGRSSRSNHDLLSNHVVSILAANLSLMIMSFQRIDLLHCYIGIFMCSFMISCPTQVQK